MSTRPGDRQPERRATDADIAKSLFPGAAEHIERVEREHAESGMTPEFFAASYAEYPAFKDLSERADLEDPEERLVWLHACEDRLRNIAAGETRQYPSEVGAVSAEALAKLAMDVDEAIRIAEETHGSTE